MSYIAEFVQDQYLFIGPVSKDFRRAWGPRATVTRPVVADTSVKQLRCCLKLDLPLRIRRTSICNAAARFGRLDLLELAQESACGWTPATYACQLAALGCHARVLKWLRSPTENWPTGRVAPNACPWDECACADAALAGRHDVVEWLRDNDCPWDGRTAALGGFFDGLQSAFAQGCPWDSESCSWAACRGDLHMLEWLRENDYPWDLAGEGGPCAGAARGGHLELIKWTRSKGCPWNERTCAEAAKGGHLEVLQWARENGCDWNSETCAGAAWGQHLGVLRWARGERVSLG
ncbi:unnamed protein product [Ectocarpus sp. CCAP 1310/34]|nr:unnamed protein product [Ectocarpus sp. CCAP 1310/34]